MQRTRLVCAALVFAILPSFVLAADSPGKPEPKTPSVRVLVVYHSMRGNTEKMALAAAEGAHRAADAVVAVKKIEEVAKQDLVEADAIVLGCPTYFAGIPGKMKTALDDWNWKLKVDFTDKIGGAFSTGGGQTGGKEFVVVSLLMFMLNNRMAVVGPLYEDEEGDDKWGEIGASAMTGPLDPGIDAKELDAARRLGERVARFAEKMKRGK